MNFATFIQRAMSTREVQVIGSDELESAMTPIWIVATMDQAFIRSYRAEMGRWFLYVTKRDSFSLEIGGEIITVKSTPVFDKTLLAAVDSAYATKYAADVELADMLTPGVVATTLALTPVGKIDIVSEATPSSL